MRKIKEEGWALPVRAKKWHYFVGSSPLCLRFRGYVGLLWHRKDDDPDNCLDCRRKRQKL